MQIQYKNNYTKYAASKSKFFVGFFLQKKRLYNTPPVRGEGFISN